MAVRLLGWSRASGVLCCSWLALVCSLFHKVTFVVPLGLARAPGVGVFQTFIKPILWEDAGDIPLPCQVFTFTGFRSGFPKDTDLKLSRLQDEDKREKLGRFRPPKLLDYTATAPCAPVSNQSTVNNLLLTWVGIKVFLSSQNWKTLTCIFVFLLVLITAAIFLIKNIQSTMLRLFLKLWSLCD